MMNDWYLDPPDEPDPPQCPECDGFAKDNPATWGMRLLCECEECGNKWVVDLIEPAPPYEPPDFEITDADFTAQSKHCPHGNEWGECDHCDHDGDLAFDAAREARHFRNR